MASRRPRTEPTATELSRIQKILEAQPGFRAHLGSPVSMSKRTGERVTFSSGIVAVAKAMMAKRLSPETAAVKFVLRTAMEVFQLPGAINFATRRASSTPQF